MALRAFGALALLLFAASAAQADTAEEAALRQASERGRQIFALDEAGWVSTDEVRRKVPDFRNTGIAGWIVEERPEGLHTTFYGLKDQRPVAIFTVESRGRSVLSSKLLTAEDGQDLTAVQTRMVQAREAAKRQPQMRCTDGAMNTVVIPPQAPEQPVDVYVLSAQVQQGEYPLGGHQLFRIGPDGALLSQRKFTNGCVNLSARAAGPSQPAALMATHLLDATPTEIHVFTARASGLPLLVVTPAALPPDPAHYRVWKVEGDAIALVPGLGK